MTTLLNLTKSLELNLAKAKWADVPKMQVKLAVDHSGSMCDEFRSGWVQSTIDLFIAAALKFDDNGSLEIGFFNERFDRCEDATHDDIGTYVKRNGIWAEGGTCFAEAVGKLKGSFLTCGVFGFGKKPRKPTYIGLITDGANSDKLAFEKQLDRLENTFIQIIAIGSDVEKSYLDYIANKYPTVEVMYLRNPRSVTVDEFYSKMLNEEFKQFAFKA